MSRFELLAPAGSFEALKAAVNAGADAVYIGGTKFGARAYADNPPCDELIQGINFCHLRGRRLYLTVNTLFKDSELNNELYEYLLPYYKAGIDAVIVQDTGAVGFITEHFPSLPIHISTQASITMAEGAEQLKKLSKNITRVVPARELSLEELSRFRKSTDLEMEVFIHGALCYCCSGQCLLSSMIGGRSGNRGRCAQPCRKKYDGKYLLSPKDQCLLPVLHELMETGIDSFKIEGRMKSPEYTAGVVAVYRKYIDMYERIGSESYSEYIKNHQRELNKDIELLKDLYNRGGFSEGYLHRHNGPDMMTFDRPNHSGVLVGEVINTRGREAVIRFSSAVGTHDVLEIRDNNDKIFEFTLGQGFDEGETFGCITMKNKTASKGMSVYRTKNSDLLESISEKYIVRDIKVPVKFRFEAHPGSRYKLKLSAVNTEIEVYGEETQTAANSPATPDSLNKQLSKLGGTDFIQDGSIEFDIDNNIFIPASKLNELRREGITALSEAITAKYCRNDAVDHKTDANVISQICEDICYSYSVWSTEQLICVIKNTSSGDIYYNLSSFNIEEIKTAVSLSEGRNLYLGLPYVSRADIIDKLESLISNIKDRTDIRYIVRTNEEESLLNRYNLEYRYDYNMYTMNSEAAALKKHGYTISTELNCDELRKSACGDSEYIVFGYQPVMISAQCVYKNKFGRCRDRAKSDFVTITDELGHDFRCRQICDFCTNIIYNSAKLNLTGTTDELKKCGVKRIRYDFTFENANDIELILAGKDTDSDEHFTNGHFRRGVQ